MTGTTGKTYLMEGPQSHDDVSSFSETAPNSHQNRGMIQRSVETVFAEAESRKCMGWTYTCQMSVLEIYNEQIRDLLDQSKDESQRCELKDNGEGVHITNLSAIQVTNPNDVYILIDHAKSARATGATNCNERSSRSHCIYLLRIEGISEEGNKTSGILNLVDLAGSERVKVSGASGDRFKESTAINKSLSSLSDVLSSLAQGEKHVPYRRSKLTHLLQPYFGGDCKTLMVVTISPADMYLPESLNSLRFAAKVNNVQLKKS
jgi:kinesin family protein C1